MNVLKGILLKIASTLLFTVMSTLVRWFGDDIPVGQVVFFRAFFAIIPVVLIYAWRRELAAMVRTKRPFGHLGRGLVGVLGMFLSFAALARIPLADVTAIGFAAPLITVVLAAVFLRERVRIYRWTAVAVGFVGVLVMLSPNLDVARYADGLTSLAAVGAVLALGSAFTSATSTIQTRHLTGSETNSAIVFYFSVIAAICGLLTWPLGWQAPTPGQLAALIVIGALGGLSHLLLTESYRLAPASAVAPFDYTAILWAFLLGYIVFGEVPVAAVFIGTAIVTAAGLFVIWRERQLGLERARASLGGPPPAE
jgi:drug/metabolite transporter (DMT)-like permease